MELSPLEKALRDCYTRVLVNADQLSVPVQEDTIFGEKIEQIEIDSLLLPSLLGEELYSAMVFDSYVPLGNVHGVTVVHGYIPNGVAKSDTGCNVYATLADTDFGGKECPRNLQEMESVYRSYTVSLHLRYGVEGQRLLVRAKKGGCA